MKKLFRVGNAIVAALMVFTLSVTAMPPQTAYADTPAAGIIRNANTATSYTTLQEAVTAATAGDVIELGSGSYAENVTIDKALTINCAQVGIDGRNRSANESIINRLYITASNVVVDGCSFNGGTDQVHVTSPTTMSGVIIRNNIFTGYSSVAIPTNNAGNILIQRNHFHSPANSGTAAAMQIKANSNPGGCTSSQVLNNLFVAATNSGGSDINLSCTNNASSNVTVSGNTSTGNSGGSSLVAFSGVTGGITISNNTATTSGSSVFFFGSVTGAVSITGNSFTNGPGSSIAIFGGELGIDTPNTGTFTITGNTLTGNLRGIRVTSAGLGLGGQVIARNNNLAGNTTAGVANEGTGSVDARGNWWGHATGPAHATNSGATGAPVTDNVIYSPWLGATPSTTPMTWRMNSTSTIQSALSLAGSGDTVFVPAGTFNEQLTITQPVTLEGAGDDAATGTILAPAAAGSVVTVTSSNVTLRGLRLNRGGVGNGISLGGTVMSNIVLDDFTATGAVNNTSSPGTGLRVGSLSTVNGLTVTNSHFDGNDIGWYISNETANSSTVTNVTITNTTFSNNSMKGLYAEKLSNAVLDGITVANSGTSGSYGFNAGIDINLKWSAFANITIKNSTVTGSGLMGSASNVLFPSAVTIKARDDAPSYASPAASLSNVLLTNLQISGGVNSLRFGEAGKTNAGPTNVNISYSSFSGFSNKALVNSSLSAITATNNWWGSSSQSGVEAAINAISGAVTFTPWYTNSGLTQLSSGVTVTDNTVVITTGSFELPVTDSGEAQLQANTNELVLGSGAVLDLDQNTTTAATVTVGGSTVSSTQTIAGQTVVLAEKVTLVSGTTDPTITIKSTAPAVAHVTVEIPNNTTIYAPSTWDGVIKPPTAVTVASTEVAPAGFSFGSTVLKVGSDDVTLVFDEVVTLLLEDVTGPVGYKAAGGGSWQLIATCGGTFASPIVPAFPGECAISDGTDTKILTFHFTEFAAFTNTVASGNSAPTTQNTAVPARRRTTSSTTQTTGDQAVAAEQAGTSSTSDEAAQTGTEEGVAQAGGADSDWKWWHWALVGITFAAVLYYLAEDRIRETLNR